MADKTNLNGQKHKAAVDELKEVGLCQRMNRLEQTPTQKWKLVPGTTYYITRIFPMLLLMIGICSTRLG
jgi:hypothetical protein